jgi:hypothetical protein
MICALVVGLCSIAGSARSSALPLPQTASQPSVCNLVSGRAAVASLPPEVRLRKMHLVRPDLIPYPIDIEVFC